MIMIVIIFMNNPFRIKGLSTSLADLKSQFESLSDRNLTMQEAIDKKMEAYQQKVGITQWQQGNFYHRTMYFMQHQTLYMVLNTIDNISESCKQYRINPIKEDKISPAESKLNHIQVCYILLVIIIYFYIIIVLNFDKLYTVLQEFCIHWSEIVAHVLHQWNET